MRMQIVTNNSSASELIPDEIVSNASVCNGFSARIGCLARNGVSARNSFSARNGFLAKIGFVAVMAAFQPKILLSFKHDSYH